MNLIVDTDDWSLLCKMYHKLEIDRDTEFTMGDVIETLHCMANAEFAFSDLPVTLTSEFFDFVTDRLNEIQSGTCGLPAPFYLQKPAHTLDKETCLTKTKVVADKMQTLFGKPVRDYYKLKPLKTVRDFKQLVNDYYMFNRLAGFQDTEVFK